MMYLFMSAPDWLSKGGLTCLPTACSVFYNGLSRMQVFSFCITPMHA